jgi:hypothetical protein
MINKYPTNPCEKCKLWQMAAKENGYYSGMCEDCFNKYYVQVVLPDVNFEQCCENCTDKNSPGWDEEEKQ